MARKKSKASTLWADEPEAADRLVGNRAAPSEMILERNGKWRRWVIYGVVGLVVINTWMQVQNAVQAGRVTVAPVSSVSVNSSLGKGVATATVNEWLAAAPSPLPGVKLITWDGYTKLAPGAKSASGSGANAKELHRFTLTVPTESGDLFYQATVEVSVSPTLGAVADGSPSLIPETPSATTGWSDTTWAGYVTVTAPGPVTDAVNAWAKAFTADPASLRLAVGDKTASHSYVPLTGATVSHVNVTGTGMKANSDNNAPSTILARVTLTVNWGGGDSPSLVTYDLLIQNAQTAAPSVVAWGGPGTGPGLAPYQNATDGTNVQGANPQTNPTAVPTPTATPDGGDQ